MDTNTIIEGTLKFRDGKKWKSRWCVLRKLSPVADCVHVQLYRDSKERYNNGQTKASLSLQYFLAVQSGFTLDKESNTIAILCEDVTVIFAFDTREQLIQWQAKIAINLGEDEQYLVQISAAPPRSKILPGPARLHVLERRFCLTDGVPPKLLGHWQIAQLRKFGVINNRFCFEGGSQCGRGEGLHILLTDQGEDISRTFQLAAQGNTPLARRAASTYFHVRERSISSSRTEANFCDKRCSESLMLADWDSRSRSQENLCWNTSRDWVCDGDLQDTCHRDGLSRPRCRSCHVKLSRSSTVTCAPGSGFTWTMESCGLGRSPSASLEHRQKTSSTIRTTGEVHRSCRPPPRPPKTKMSLLEGDISSTSKKPRPSPSMPTISRCACDPPKGLNRDISSSAITEMGEDYYDTPRSFKTSVCDHAMRTSFNCPRSHNDCFCQCRNPLMPHSASVSQAFIDHGEREEVGCQINASRSTSYFPPTRSFSQSEEEPTSLSSDPGWHPDSSHVLDTHSNCCCYMNVKANTLCHAKKCVKSVTFSELPPSILQQKPNYANIDFAESLKFYENCKDCYNKLLEEFEDDQGRLSQSGVTVHDSCSTCTNCLREREVSSTQTVQRSSHNSPDESQGYIKMSSLANITSKETFTRCTHEPQKESPICGISRSKSSMCLHSASKSPRYFKLKSISDPEIHLLPSNRKRPKIALSKIIDLIRNVRPITAQEIQRHARKPILPSYKSRKEDSHYHSADTISSDTMVNTNNDMSVKGSLNSLCSETTHDSGVNRFISTSQLNLSLSSLDELKSSKVGIEGRSDCDLEKYKDHLRALELPVLPLDSEYLRHDSTCYSAIRRSCTVTFKPGHNRDSSSSNDSGVSTASLRLRRTDFTEFEMPVTTSLSGKLLREYALGQAGKSSSDLSLPRRSKSIDPLGELVFQFQDSTSTAKSTSALLNVVAGKEGRVMRFIDAPSTSSGTSDLSDYMDNLSISSYSSNDNPRLSRCAVTTLKPRSGKEYHKIDRSTLKPTEEGTSGSTGAKEPV